jgi:TonB family protein
MLAYYLALSAAMTGNNSYPDASVTYLELIRPPIVVVPASGGNPVPTGNPGLWVTTNDYPPEALREEREGVVGFSLTVGPDGRVSLCKVTTSSGHTDLDAAACALITQRARFDPARNAKGIARIGQYANRVRWQIPTKGRNVAWNVPIPKAGQVNLSFIVDENGKPSNCEITAAATIAEARTPCDAGVTFQPYYNDRGERIRIKVQTSQTVNITEANDTDLKPD